MTATATTMISTTPRAEGGFEASEQAPVAYAIRTRVWQLEYHFEGERWTIVDRETGIFGHGPDLLAAQRDFDDAVAEHLDVLEREPELSEDLNRQLSYLRDRVA